MKEIFRFYSKDLWRCVMNFVRLFYHRNIFAYICYVLYMIFEWSKNAFKLFELVKEEKSRENMSELLALGWICIALVFLCFTGPCQEELLWFVVFCCAFACTLILRYKRIEFWLNSNQTCIDFCYGYCLYRTVLNWALICNWSSSDVINLATIL